MVNKYYSLYLAKLVAFISLIVIKQFQLFVDAKFLSPGDNFPATNLEPKPTYQPKRARNSIRRVDRFLCGGISGLRQQFPGRLEIPHGHSEELFRRV